MRSCSLQVELGLRLQFLQNRRRGPRCDGSRYEARECFKGGKSAISIRRRQRSSGLLRARGRAMQRRALGKRKKDPKGRESPMYTAPKLSPKDLHGTTTFPQLSPGLTPLNAFTSTPEAPGPITMELPTARNRAALLLAEK